MHFYNANIVAVRHATDFFPYQVWGNVMIIFTDKMKLPVRSNPVAKISRIQ